MNGDPKESIRYFGRVAAEWDNLRQSFFSESLREKAVGVAGVQPGKLAVDVGQVRVLSPKLSLTRASELLH